MKRTRRKPSDRRQSEFLRTLEQRFETNMKRHPGLRWPRVQARLETKPDKLWSLAEMERTGGEPDVVALDGASREFVFMDCSPESPTGRRSVCYDRQGLESRKDHRPKTTALDEAAAMGIAMLTEEEYLALQQLGEFDTKTSSWIATPVEFRRRGGALWGGRSYGRVFIGCNGAQSYYAARGFRGVLKV